MGKIEEKRALFPPPSTLRTPRRWSAGVISQCWPTHFFRRHRPCVDGAQAKYDASVASMIATLRYGHGMPWNRIQQLQKAAGIPLPASVQWEQVRDAIELGPGEPEQGQASELSVS